MKLLPTAFALLLGFAATAECATRRKPVAKKQETVPATGPKPALRGDDPAEGPAAKGTPRTAAVSSIEPEELAGFEHYPPQIQRAVREALALTRLNLTYTFGSSDPKAGGMDCSGAIYHLLGGLGIKGVPRQSDEMCGWVQRQTLLHRTASATSLAHPELGSILPGDLLFWSATYGTSAREIPVTHVMLYLGRLKKGGKPVMFGSSDGRTYLGERRTGVSVFDFTFPREAGKARFYGYGLVPGIGGIAVKTQPVIPDPVIAAAQPAAEKPDPDPSPAKASASAKPVGKARPKPKPGTKPKTRQVP